MPTKTEKQVYLLAQEHCGLKVGDWVKVIREPKKCEAGWKSINIYDISDMIGRTFQIDGIYNTGIAVKRDNSDYVAYFPYFVLEKVENPTHQFKPFDKVLVRDALIDKWRCSLFSHFSPFPNNEFKYRCIESVYKYCIPYEGNEHLVGTTDMPKGDKNE